MMHMDRRVWAVAAVLPVVATAACGTATSTPSSVSSHRAAAAPTDRLTVHCQLHISDADDGDDYSYRVGLGITRPDGRLVKRWFADPPPVITDPDGYRAGLVVTVRTAPYGTYTLTLVIATNDGSEPASMACRATLPRQRDTTLPVVATVGHWREQAATSLTYFSDGSL
jgi:hypothetical protein